MDNFRKKVGERINTALANRNVKQKDLAKAIGVTDNTISYYVSGARTPNTEQIVKIAQYLGVSADYLLGLSDVATTDADVKRICDATGLSEKAVDRIMQNKDNFFYRQGLNRLACDRDLPSLIARYLYGYAMDTINNSDFATVPLRPGVPDTSFAFSKIQFAEIIETLSRLKMRTENRLMEDRAIKERLRLEFMAVYADVDRVEAEEHMAEYYGSEDYTSESYPPDDYDLQFDPYKEHLEDLEYENQIEKQEQAKYRLLAYVSAMRQNKKGGAPDADDSETR